MVGQRIEAKPTDLKVPKASQEFLQQYNYNYIAKLESCAANTIRDK